MKITATETQEQEALVRWLQYMKLDYFAPINENSYSSKNRRYAMILEQKNKKKGKVAGVSDLIVFAEKKILFIELKRIKNSKTSEHQKQFLNTVNSYDYAVGRVCKGWIEAKEFIEEMM